LKRHPFPVVARFDRVVAVSFAFPEAVLRPLVAAGLEIDTYEGLGFVTVAMVWTRSLRPAGFPSVLGQDFFLAGYRIFTRLNDHGRRLRGLQILRSETDRWPLVWFGNLMTGYRYVRASVTVQQTGGEMHVRTRSRAGIGIDVAFAEMKEGFELPSGSPFADWRTARRFAGPMPFTFSAQGNRTFVVVEGRREEWTPRPVRVTHWAIGLFDEPPFRGITPILANAFAVEDIDYRWEKGRVVAVAP
jgi:hypothetical protein